MQAELWREKNENSVNYTVEKASSIRSTIIGHCSAHTGRCLSNRNLTLFGQVPRRLPRKQTERFNIDCEYKYA